MAKVLSGKVTSVKMQDTVIVEVTRFVPHPLYKKLMKRSKSFKVAVNGHTLEVGRRVKIVETKPMSKDKYFKVQEVIAEQHEKSAAKVKVEKVVEAPVAPSVAKALDGKEVKVEKKVKAKAVKGGKK
jgi:small subunit ribosomal protein S17